ncbi:MAG TPA: DUF3313 family protein [Rhizomicrobium sp.]|nr:DUF3313 family protein [Rhizomicrobium sp.]
MNKTLLALITSISIVIGFGGLPAKSQSDQQGASDMVPLASAKVKFAKIRPGTDWSKYKTIALSNLRVPAEVRDAKPKGTRPSFGESYVLGDKEVAALQSAYADAMKDALGKSYTFVTTPGPDTMIINGEILDITLTAPVESTRRTYASAGRTYSRTAGTIALGMVIADGTTNQVIAMMADQHVPNDVWQINNATTNMAQAKYAFGRWGRALRDRLANVNAP